MFFFISSYFILTEGSRTYRVTDSPSVKVVTALIIEEPL